MFVDFVGYPYSQIYILTNVYQSSKLSCINVMQQTNYPQNYVPTNQQNFDNP